MFKEKPKAVIFDWDNTLVNTIPTLHLALNRFMKKMNKPQMSIEEVKENTRKPSKQNLKNMFGDNWEEAKKSWINTYEDSHLDKLSMMPNAQETINLLAKHSISLFIISNKTGEILRQEVEHLNLRNNFIGVVGSGDADYDKPAPEVVDFALEGTELNPKNDPIWFIGDGISDIECAINSNCQPFLYGDEYMLINALFKKKNPDVAVNHIPSYETLMENINKYW